MGGWLVCEGGVRGKQGGAFGGGWSAQGRAQSGLGGGQWAAGIEGVVGTGAQGFERSGAKALEGDGSGRASGVRVGKSIPRAKSSAAGIIGS